MRQIVRLLVGITLLALLFACGQKGALYLPQEKPAAKVDISTITTESVSIKESTADKEINDKVL